ncbi:bifunctional epoxide hydrolase 2-like protein [Cinnamomum micranthum f. kanehirae]|uniref:soluble epoxide hydrolase n=1 Tax=Cinnamomum micranthum f. kanehirae TaxID=337451 RepID=A0A3S3NWE4_9MAGN|nr:bifunctional epoxide hydrolase 2-like protein [Cinnamomum micranthum f. kanehirae]
MEELEEGISHRTVEVNGINMHIAEKGHGPPVLLLHGFPELWYAWRHQIAGLAARGYRALAPDLRGFGDTDAPSSNAYSVHHIVGDLIALIDALELDQVYVVGHDWGAIVAWYLCEFRGDRVKGLVALSVTFRPRNPAIRPLPTLRALYGDDYYICRFQEPGAAEADFARTGTATLLKILLTYRHPGPLIVPKGGFVDWPDKQLILPSWLSEKDIRYYAEKFDRTGFTGGLNYYRALDLNWELTAPWTGAQVKVPVKFIVGDLDLSYNTMGTKEYIDSGRFKKDVPFLEDVVVMKGVGHFINEERPDEITAHIHEFIQKH